jgi:20S proteasome alpha/beta subunit
MERQKGTTIVAVAYGDMCAIAAERQVTAGYLISSIGEKKLRKVNENLVLGAAGAVGHIQKFADFLRYEAELYELRESRPLSVSSAAKVLSLLPYRMGVPYAEFVLAGRDEKGVEVYLVDAIGGIIRDEKVSTGSGARIAYGVLDDKLDELKKKKRVRVEDLAWAVASAVLRARARDIGSGGGIDVYMIDRQGIREDSFGPDVTQAKIDERYRVRK